MADQPSSVTQQNMQEHIKELEQLIRDWREEMERWFPYTWNNSRRWLLIQERILELGIRRKDSAG